MKNYSDNSVSREDLSRAVQQTAETASAKIDEVDQKQARQIQQLRIWCACLTIALAAQLAFLISVL